MIRASLVILTILVAFMAAAAPAQTVERCGTMQYLSMLQQQDPKLAQRMAAIEAQTQAFVAQNSSGGPDVVRTIPVVVHVVWNTAAENISDAQILAQIQVLNEDFRRTNPDAGNTLAQFQPVAADSEIMFCLATRDPAGAPTTGITRTQTATTSFGTSNSIKSTASGGHDPWPASSYLNIWVCDLGSGLLGYAQFPGGPASTDGVVVDYAAFGVGGTATAPYHLGRSATHEIGHWLNLYHIWGDVQPNCGDDLVADTPMSDQPHFGCPLTTVACGGLNMVQNYMDYSDDSCMNLYTQGQKVRMQALFAPGGARASILASQGCGPSTPLYQVNQAHSSLDIDGVLGTAGSPAASTKCIGSSGVVHLAAAAADVGLPYDTAVSLAALVPANAGGVTFPDGQMVNVSLAGLLFLSTGTGTAGLPPWPGDYNLPFTIAAPATFALQKIQVTPALPLGLALSQGSQLSAVTGGTFPAGPTGDDTSVTVALGGATCSSPIVFFGTAYSQLFVSSNGQVCFGSQNNDYSPTLAEARTGPARVGFWTDLNPAAGGSITINSPSAGVIRVSFTGVPYYGTSAFNSFAMEFNTVSNTVALDNLLPIVPNPSAAGAGGRQFLGITRGTNVATDGGPTSFAPGTSGAPANATNMIYQFYDTTTQTGGLVTSLLTTALNRIVFTPLPSGNYSWAGF